MTRFGRIARRWVERRAITEAELARAHAQAERAALLFDFAAFCAQQQQRVRATLKQQTQRIDEARWGDMDGDGSHFYVSRKGTTCASEPVDRRYQDQWS